MIATFVKSEVTINTSYLYDEALTAGFINGLKIIHNTAVMPPPNLTKVAIEHLLYHQVNKVLDIFNQDQQLKNVVGWMVRRDWQAKDKHWPFAYLPILTSRLFDGNNEAGVCATVAWNLGHLAAQILDNIADENPVVGPDGVISRGEAVTIATAILAGASLALDSLPAMGISMVTHHQLRCQFNQTYMQMALGQYQDLTKATRYDFDLDDYWKIIASKSGRFFGWACYAGALIGGGSPTEVECCEAYGYNLGVIIQIIDDWIDLGKTRVMSDLALGKRTLPILYALSVASSEQKTKLERLLSRARHHTKAEVEAHAEITHLGGLHYTLIQAQVRRQRAETKLRQMPDKQARHELYKLLNTALCLS